MSLRPIRRSLLDGEIFSPFCTPLGSFLGCARSDLCTAVVGVSCSPGDGDDDFMGNKTEVIEVDYELIKSLHFLLLCGLNAGHEQDRDSYGHTQK